MRRVVSGASFRAVGAVLCCICLMMACGCASLMKPPPASSDESGVPSPSAVSPLHDDWFRLRFDPADGINPYTVATGGNLELCKLLYEGLTRLEDDWTVSNALAQLVDAADPLSVIVTLRADAKMSDGSPVVAADVVMSFTAAKSSEWFAPMVANIQTAVAVDESTVRFALVRNEPNAGACFSFPVMRVTDSGMLGSGRYVFESGGSPSLSANPYNASAPAISTIQLVNFSGDDSFLHAVEGGTISFFFTDMSDGMVPYAANSRINVPLAQLVYIGVNANRDAVSNVNVRLAVSHAISRAEIVGESYDGWARTAVGPFHSAWADFGEISVLSENENIAKSVAHLAQAGYNSGASDNQQVKNLTVEMLVAADGGFREAAADLIVIQLARVGITVNVTKLSLAELKNRLQNGSFDMYIGEARMTVGMSLDMWLRSGGSCSYGINGSAGYDKLLSGEVDINGFCETFAAEMPYIPVCWRDGLSVFRRTVEGVSSTAFDPFYGLENWTVS